MKKFFTVCMACILMVSHSSIVNATSVNDLKRKREEIRDAAQSANRELEDTKAKKSAAQAEVDKIDENLAVVTEEYNFISSELEQTQELLELTEEELIHATEDKDKQYGILKERVKYMYMDGKVGYLEVLFKAHDFSEFLTRLDYINRIAEYDQNMFKELRVTEETISEKVDQTEKKRIEIEVLMSQQAKKQEALQATLDEKNRLIVALTNDEQKYTQQINELNESDKNIEKMIKDIQAEAIRKAEEAKKAAAKKNASAKAVAYKGGKLAWPVPSRSGISSGYGYRQSPINKRREFHTGIDIPASTGSSIVSAESGKVIFAGKQNGYGNVIIVDHGGGISTLYAHCSSLVARLGSTVSRGQTIAKIGSTGYSTGPHLHFEVRAGGSHKNPMSYLK